MKIPMTGKIIVPAETLINEIGGESVILSLKSASYFGLDEMGTRMWQVLVSSDSIQAAYEQLLAEYDVEDERLRTDLMNLIAKLEEHKLAEVHSE
jgi:hypothetical protein